MGDGWAAALAVSTALGAWGSRRVPLWLGLVLATVALVARRPVLVCVGVAVLASALGARSWAGLDPPAPATAVRGRATLVTDPVVRNGAVRMELRIAGRRVEAWARGRPAALLRPAMAGERVDVAGRLSPVPARSRAYLARRHVAARMTVTTAGEPRPGSFPGRVANDLRRTLLRGAASLPEEHRALFAGFVLGDDRAQSPASVDDFRGAGLSHLLAVSGQNVAFVLALATPLLRYLGLRGRLVAGVAVLAAFGLLTRWEPSVLRASFMAGVALLAASAGRPASTLRVLALAVTALLLIDPLLVGAVGFLLSVGACAGIAVLAPPLSRRLPLPVAVTLAAQAGVAPVLVPVFGGVPVASIPANILALPAAGPVMVWGLAAGLPAGLVGGAVAHAVHLPTRLLVAWIAGVARWGAALPLGQMGAVAVVLLVAVAVLGALVPKARTAAVMVAVVIVLWPSVAPPTPAAGSPLAGGGRLWRSGSATVLVVGQPQAGPLLEALRTVGVRRLSVLVVTSSSRSAQGEIEAVLSRHPADLVLTPDRALAGQVVTAGRLRLQVTAVEPRLDVSVTRPA